MIVEAPTYAAFKRERLIRGPSVLPPFLPLRRDLSFSSTTDDTDAATLAICHSKAMALDRMLRAEVADARRDRLRTTKQAAIAVERRLVLRQNAARLLQRAMRNYKNHQTQRRVDACRCIMHWWRKWKPPKSIHECVSIAQYVESRNVDPASIQAMPSHSIARQQHPHAVSCTTCALHTMGQVPTSRQQPSSISSSIQQPASLDDSMDQDAPATRGLVLELLALRGLAVASSWTSLHAIICAFHQTRPYTTLETGHIRCHAGELNWDANNVLSWQPHNVGRVALSDWHCTVKVYRHDSHGDAKCVGQVHLPADLLESSLAKNQTLTQWFPLEKAVPGDVVRGEVRISFQYDEEISGVASPRQQLEWIDALNTLASPRSTTSSRQDIKSPHHPRDSKLARAPPAKPRDSLSPENKSPSRMPFTSPSKCTATNQTQAGRAKPPHPYLKRKPFRVRFEKLDWSSVSSKTDSNVPKGATAPPAATTPPAATQHGSTLETLLSFPSQRKLALIHLKHKTELHTIFHRPSNSVIPTMTRPMLSQLQKLPVTATMRRLDHRYAALKQSWLLSAGNNVCPNTST